MEFVTVVIAIFALAGVANAEMCAKCELEVNWNLPAAASLSASGCVTFIQPTPTSETFIYVEFSGFNETETETLHGFHIHKGSDLSRSCDSVDAHYNPFNYNHAGPDAEERHVGDLGNIVVAPDGSAVASMWDSWISLYGDANVLGRAMVIHKDEDDLGLGGNAESLKTGNAGARLLCCVIQEIPCEDI